MTLAAELGEYRDDSRATPAPLAYPFRRPRPSRSGACRLAPGDVKKTQAGTVPLPG